MIEYREHKWETIFRTLAVIISVSICITVLYTSYDYNINETIDNKINDFAQDWIPPNAIETTKTTTTVTTHKEPFVFSAAGLGTIQGYIHKDYDDVVEFKGIPFAKPPIGNKRFMQAEPASAWNGILDASSAPRCLRAFEQILAPGSLGTDGGSEDCLYLSLYVPKHLLDSGNNETVAVYVYFHGGAYLAGSSNQQDGGYIASTQNIIIISANYRLGVFGFWFHSSFDPNYPSSTTDSGNQGLLDQQMAMKWTRGHYD